MIHKHKWRYLDKKSTRMLDLYDCSCGAFAQVHMDVDRMNEDLELVPIYVEAGDANQKRIQVPYGDLRRAKESIFGRLLNWIIR